MIVRVNEGGEVRVRLEVHSRHAGDVHAQHDVAVHHIEMLGQSNERPDNPPRVPQWLALHDGVDAQPEPRPVLHKLNNTVGEMTSEDGHVSDPGALSHGELMLESRKTAN